MNRIIIVILIILSYPIIGYSQIGNYGLKFGIQSAGVNDNPFAEQRLMGFSMYGFTDLNIFGRIFLTIDLGVTQRGFRTTIAERNERGESIQDVIATSKLTYISLSPFVNVNTSIVSLSTYFGIAPRMDILIARKKGEFKFTNITQELRLVDLLDKYVFGVSIVAGIKNIELGGINLRLEGKYEIDITDSMSKYPANYRNNVIMFVLGVGL